MADEIKSRLQVTVKNGSLSKGIDTGELKQTQNAVGDFDTIITVSNSAEADITVANISTLGVLILQNLDATNYVRWGPKSGGVMVPVGRIPAGDFARLRLEPGITLRWIANAAPVKVRAWITED